MRRKELYLQRYESDVEAIAGQYKHVGEPLEDMLQDGREAVIRAAIELKCDPCEAVDEQVRGMIRTFICKALREHGYTVRVPRRIAEETNHHPVMGLSESKEVWELAEATETDYETLLQAVERLSPKQQTLIRLLYGQEDAKKTDSKAVAQQMGIGQNAVQHLRRRTLRRLRAHL